MRPGQPTTRRIAELIETLRNEMAFHYGPLGFRFSIEAKGAVIASHSNLVGVAQYEAVTREGQ